MSMQLGLTLTLAGVLGSPSGDKQRVLDRFRFPHDCYGRPVRTDPEVVGRHLSRVVSPAGKFLFEVGSFKGEDEVGRLVVALQIAAGFLENAIAFRNQIRVQVNHADYCVNGGVCHNTAGTAYGKKWADRS